MKPQHEKAQGEPSNGAQPHRADSYPDPVDWLPLFRQRAADLGFINAGITPAVDSAGFTELVKWIESGYAAGMQYFADRLDAYRNADGVMAGTKSIIVLAYPYPADADTAAADGLGSVARYAWPGADYHDTIHAKLKQLKRLVAELAPTVSTRGCIDTAPLMERELAQLAGLGWRGKNTLLLHRQHGSYFFLACFLVDVELPYDAPHHTSHCGTCTACLDACPTDAFPAPGVLDASRCISYLTIEHRDAIPLELREGIGSWVFGCDVCQEVCPWNRKPARRSETPTEQRVLDRIDLESLFEIDEDTFRARYRKSPFWRTRLRGMRRNAAIVLGNQGNPDALPALKRGADDEDEVVAEACRWAIQKIRQPHP